MQFERTTAEDGSIEFRLPGTNHNFAVPHIDDGVLGTLPRTFFELALDATAGFVARNAAIVGDATLSTVGKEQKLDPERQKLVEQLAASAASLDEEVAHANRLEAKLTAVPMLDPTHSVMAAEDRERRDWWRSQSAQDRAALLKQIDDDPAGNEPLMAALLRSPVPMLDHEKAFVRTIWNRTRRLANPTDAVVIDNARAATDWARRGLLQVAAIGRNELGWDHARVLRTVLTCPNEKVQRGAGVFGFNGYNVAQMRQMLDFEARRKVA